jgi:membrane protein YqaA with SNARE-associated domain
MRLFSKLYEHMLRWAQHRHAPYYLVVVSFIESSLFPIPPDVMLAPMSLTKPERALWYATITTFASVIGALFGYIIGMFFFHWAEPLLKQFGYWAAYQQVHVWFAHWGGWVLFVAGFSPIPFKLFTIAGGALHMSLLPFILGSFLGRGLRFYLVAILMCYGGKHIDRVLKRSIDWIGWIVVVLLIIGYVTYYCLKTG